MSTDSAGWRSGALVALAALVTSYSFVVLLDRYWRFYHLGTPGSGMGLLYLVLPAGLVLSSALGFLLWNRLGRTYRANAFALGAMVLLFGLLFAGELWRTTEYRSGEGPGAGDLAPFFASFVPGR